MPNDYKLDATEIKVLQCKTGRVLPGPKEAEFSCVFEGKKYFVEVHQAGGRITTIRSQVKSTANELYRLFLLFDEYQMLYDGEFYPISEIRFIGANQVDLDQASQDLISQRLSMYQSVDFVQGSYSKLADSFPFLTKDYFTKWMDLSRELGIIHAMFLYNTADTGMPIDLKCAHLIELYEPLAELIGLYKPFFPTLNTEDRNTSLKMCLDAVFSWFATDIFEKEFSTNKEKFLKLLVWSRNRIMHIKRKWGNEKYLSGPESALYCIKLSLLYRRILFDLLGVDYQQYKEAIRDACQKWENHEGIFSSFLVTKLS